MNPIVEQIRNGTAPERIKLFAAQGLLPLLEEEIILVQVALTADADQQIAQTALQALRKVHADTWFRLVEKSNPDPQVVSFVIEQPFLPDLIREKVLLNQSVPDSVVRDVAARKSGALLDLVISNHVRLLRDPEILNALESNRSLTIDQRRRVEEFKTEFIVKKQKKEEPAPPPAEALTFEDILQRIPTLDVEAQRLIQEIEHKPQEELSEEQVQQTLRTIFAVEDIKQIPEETLSTYQRIMKMKAGEKVRLALLGTKEERAILIRDANKSIASLVLKSPKLTEPEMENFSQMRNLDGDLLRQMTMSRDFIKKYTVVLTLVRNPKTPSAAAINLLKLLRDFDLRNVHRDKEIPEIIRRQAKRTYDLRQETKG